MCFSESIQSLDDCGSKLPFLPHSMSTQIQNTHHSKTPASPYSATQSTDTINDYALTIKNTTAWKYNHDDSKVEPLRSAEVSKSSGENVYAASEAFESNNYKRSKHMSSESRDIIDTGALKKSNRGLQSKLLDMKIECDKVEAQLNISSNTLSRSLDTFKALNAQHSGLQKKIQWQTDHNRMLLSNERQKNLNLARHLQRVSTALNNTSEQFFSPIWVSNRNLPEKIITSKSIPKCSTISRRTSKALKIEQSCAELADLLEEILGVADSSNEFTSLTSILKLEYLLSGLEKRCNRDYEH